MKAKTLIAASLVLAGLTAVDRLRADVVTDWNANAEQAILAAAQGPPVQGRSLAIVHAAIYDAVNGIERKYTRYFVSTWGPRNASSEAAAAQAGYTALLGLFPTQKAPLDVQLATSLSKIKGSRSRIAHGEEWGKFVANAILAWRSTDGFTTPLPGYFGSSDPGVWRSPPAGASPDGTLPAIFPQVAVLVPFTMSSHDQFRPGPPPALTSVLYAVDLNEVKAVGRFDSAIRTPEQTQIALLWQAVGQVNENHAVRPVIESKCRHLKPVDTARIFALINFAAEDATIAGFDSKYAYNLWRPYHAIRLADTDGNPDTEADPTWDSLFTAPRFQEYMSNHAVLTTAFMNTLAELLGDDQTFTLSAPGHPNFTWTFERLSDATAQVVEARIWAGIHYRNSCDVGVAQGMKIASYVLDNFLAPIRNHCDGDEE